MIPQETIAKIKEACRIEEVVGDFVTLKRRGVNMIGLCPFHNEKTPSFTVSPAKGICHCFGCGKGGDSVSFIMELENYTYPEALKYLAKKYGIQIVEEEQTPEQIKALGEREAMLHLSEFAQKYFSKNIFENEKGRSIGLSYFKERGFSESTIEKFQLGYCLDEWDAFTKEALKNGYSENDLVKTGLSVKKDDGKFFDRFKGRVIFPIHSSSGKVIGFGGRILTNDKKAAKYVNSPESEIYNKSKELYGLAFAKSQIISKNNCYLVEGYTDVISLSQAGIPNVVASSGTSLTTEQIKLISRFTKNITILYDGDWAGIKASFRGIDMILEQGLNVKVLLFPDGEDPDSFARSRRTLELQEYLENNTKDFIHFKIEVLKEEADKDPLKKAELIKDILNSISLIPDVIIRQVYITECSRLLKIEETTLVQEITKIFRSRFKKEKTEDFAGVEPVNTFEKPEEIKILNILMSCEAQEKNILRLLLKHGNRSIYQHFPRTPEEIENSDDGKDYFVAKVNVADFIVTEILHDEMDFDNDWYKIIFTHVKLAVDNQNEIDVETLMQHENPEIRSIVSNILISQHELSSMWKDHGIRTPTEEDDIVLSKNVLRSIFEFKMKKVDNLLHELAEKLKTTNDEEEQIIILGQMSFLKKQQAFFAKEFNRVVTK